MRIFVVASIALVVLCFILGIAVIPLDAERMFSHWTRKACLTALLASRCPVFDSPPPCRFAWLVPAYPPHRSLEEELPGIQGAVTTFLS